LPNPQGLNHQLPDFYTSVFPDVPHIYLVDREQWVDFKKQLATCGCQWNLPNWKQTIRFNGVEWNDLMKTDCAESLKAIFPEPVLQLHGPAEGKYMPVADLAKKCLSHLKLTTHADEFNAQTAYCDLTTLKFEHETITSARQKMWTWILNAFTVLGHRQSPTGYIT